MTGHGASHDPEPDETDFHASPPPAGELIRRGWQRTSWHDRDCRQVEGGGVRFLSAISVAQCLRRRAEYAEIAPDSDEGGAHLHVATGILPNRRKDTDGLA